jgi:uncharacterized protein with NAD-binding domain and iron-sulfur cluster
MDRVLVIGAGLAGLGAADRLLSAGVQVTLVDAFPLPGGRTASFDVPGRVSGLVAGDVVEHGLHAWFQHYHAVFDLMQRAGLPKPPFSGRGVSFWNPQHGHLQVPGGPGAWLVHSLRLPPSLRGDRGRALSAFGRLIGELPGALSDPQRTDRESAHGLLSRHGVPPEAIEHVFRPVMYSLTSMRLEQLSALELLRWMSSILPDPRMRCVEAGTTAAMGAPIAESLRRRGADLRLGVEVEALDLDAHGHPRLTLARAPDRTGLRHVLVPGFEPAEPPDPARFDAVVSTLPWERLRALGGEGLWAFAPFLQRDLDALDNIHPLTIRLWFERPVEGAAESYILSSDTLFDVLRPTPEPARYGGIRMIDALVENVDSHLPELGYDRERYLEPGAATEAVVQRVLADLERLYPGQIRGNRVLRRFLHTREGIVACRPGTWARRPPAHIGSQRFFLAGDFTRQPYGVCMEGAVRSGQLAAEALLGGRPVEPQRAPFAEVQRSLLSVFERR